MLEKYLVLARYLPALDCGIVIVPKDVQQLVVGGHLRIVVEVDSLGVIAQAVVWGPVLGAAGIAHPGADDARRTPELTLGKPKSGHPKGGLLCLDRGLEQGHGWSTQVAHL